MSNIMFYYGGKIRPWDITFDIKSYLKFEKIIYPCVLLVQDNWDDFSFVTRFKIIFYPNGDESINLGFVKILDAENKETKLQEKFTSLDASRYYSLGENLDYYDKLLKRLSDVYEEILKSLNDIVINKIDKKYFESSSNELLREGFSSSLMRESDTEKAFNDGKAIFDKRYEKKSIMKFVFSFRPELSEKNLELRFNFEEDDLDMNRINVLIGENGTGKTQALAKFALAFTDTKHPLNKITLFSPRPNFGRVIAISYSVFDDFEIPKNIASKSYMYFGHKNPVSTHKISGTVSIDTKTLKQSIYEIKENDRIDDWKKYLADLIGEEAVPKIKRRFFDTDPPDISESSNSLELSSGQCILLTVFTNLIAHIRKDTLVLFDEPETHLHPNGIATLMRVLYAILKKYDAYSIIATHSPIVLQQVPAKYVNLFIKRESVTKIMKLQNESFGENLSTITNEVFGVDKQNWNYARMITDFLEKKSADEVEEYFNKNMGLNARLVLKSLENEKRQSK